MIGEINCAALVPVNGSLYEEGEGRMVFSIGFRIFNWFPRSVRSFFVSDETECRHSFAFESMGGK